MRDGPRRSARPLVAVASAALFGACQPALVPLAGPRAPAPMRATTASPATTTSPPATASPAATGSPPATASPPVTTLPAATDFPDHAYLRSRRLMVPVDGRGILDVDDTFDHARSGDRVHRAVDVRAPRGTPVVSTDDGRVLAIKSNALGGLTVYCTDPAGKLVYYYAHLDRYAAGLTEGQAVRQGDVLGYVGTTGNAPPDVPHLHFQVMRLVDPKRYWDGPVLDPRPYFTRDGGLAAGTR